MPEQLNIPDENVLFHRCAFCGIAVYPREVAADISMKFVDYFNRIPNGMLEGVACKECWDKVLANVQATQEYCISKRNQAEKGWTK